MGCVNIVALDDFGGLQTLFLSLARLRARQGRPLLTINRAEAPPLDIFTTQIAQCGSGIIPSPRSGPAYRAAALIPWGLLRRSSQRLLLTSATKSVMRRAQITTAVYWNAIPMPAFVPPGGRCILYDHGFSSLHKPTRMKRLSLRTMSAVVAISKANARLLQERWDWQRDIVVLPNPLRQDIADHPLVERKQCLRDGKIVLGCASRLVSFKGIASVIHAVAVLKARGLDVSLRIAGDGPEAELLKATARDLGLADQVVFEGIVSDMVPFFSRIDIFVAPSLREPCGLSPMEAIASGVPTILSHVDGHCESLPFEGAATVIEPDLPLADYARLGSSLHKMPDFVYSPARDSLVTPRALKPEAVAEAVSAIAGAYDRHAAIAAKAGSQIRHRNSIQAYSERFSAVFEDACANVASPTAA